MSDDPSRDALRRQLRFSLVLQGFAAVMLTGALVIRAAAGGFDVMTLVLAVAVLVVGGAAIFTLSRLRAIVD